MTGSALERESHGALTRGLLSFEENKQDLNIFIILYNLVGCQIVK